MANAETTEKKSSLTRGKAILIAVLAVVLVAVLYIQFGSSGEAASGPPVAYHPPGPPAVAKPAQAAASTQAAVKPGIASNEKPAGGKETATVPIIDETHWKAPNVSSVTSYDPFALPPSFPQPAKKNASANLGSPEALLKEQAANDAKRLAEEIQKVRLQLKELEARGVHVIFRQGDQTMAMIDDRMLHVGDEIDGFVVTAIDPKGVHVERKKSP